MNEKQITYIMAAIAALVYFGLLISIPIRRKKIFSAAGKLILPLENGFTYRIIGIFILAAAIIAVIPFRNFAFYIGLVLFLCALIATEFGVRESIGLGKAGIYENLISWGTNTVFYDDIYSLPTLAYEDDPETLQVDKKLLEIIRKNGVKVILIFSTEEKRQLAVQKILEQAPNLKPEK